MEQDATQFHDYISTAKTGLDIAQQSGLLRRVVSIFSSRKSGEVSDYRKKAVEALLDNAVETLAGLELTVVEASRILAPGFTLENLGKVNPTWEKHWTEGASKVGVEDKERRTWWARLLAGEIQQPGAYSLRTLAVMDTLSTKEAQLFSKLCDYVWNPSNPVLIQPSEKSTLWKPTFDEAAMLESSRLALLNASGEFTWGTTKGNTDAMTTNQLPPIVPMEFNGNLFVVSGSDGSSVRLRCGSLLLTDVGKEMYRLTTPDHQMLYCDEVVTEWRRSYNVQQVPIGPAREPEP